MLQGQYQFNQASHAGAIRILLYGHYRITYLIISLEKIDILGVFHGAVDIDRFQL